MVAKIQSLKERERNLVLITAGVLILAAVFQWGLRPLKNRWEELDTQILLVRKQLRQAQKLQAERAEYGKIEGQSQAWLSQIPSGELVLPWILGQIEELGAQFQVTVSRVKPLRARSTETRSPERIEVEGSGQADSILRLVHALRSTPTLLEIERLEMNVEGSGEQSVKFYMLVERPR
ncbi:MAG: type 4a pilus biogenesis protein PilO [Candidatus Omnitrophica bacterium]|nr:type 4a pilus biogenesis protein PilO [Candidatus Omnitrophota bacterium]